jgi:Ca-activated chloride channel family protein
MRVCHLSRAAPRFFILLTVIPAAFTPAQQPAAPSSEPIRVSVDRVNVGVIVTDSRGNFVGGLRREDFRVFDDGMEQPLTDFTAIEEPAQVVMLVEAGPSVYFLAASHLQAAHALLEGLSAGDRVTIVKYDQAPQRLLDFTPDKQAAAAALDNVRFNVGFGMLNLSRSLSTVLDWLMKVQGKKTIVLLSTGVDTSPPEEPAAILTRLKTSDVRILAVSLSGELRSPPPSPKRKNKAPSEKSAVAQQGFAEADHLLTLLAEATGGRAYFPNDANGFAGVYAEIAQLVRHEYSLAFAPPAHDGKTHAIEVRVTAAPSTPTPAYRIDYRRAYLAPAVASN